MENITIEHIKISDLKKYFKALNQADSESKYFTGTTTTFTISQVENYIKKTINDESRVLFTINISDNFVGEVALSDIENKSCHFRICIFKKENFSKGIGSFATRWIINYAFNTLLANEIELEVFPFNKRGIALYEKLGFKKLDTIIDNEAEDPYKEIILMKLIK